MRVRVCILNIVYGPINDYALSVALSARDAKTGTSFRTGVCVCVLSFSKRVHRAILRIEQKAVPMQKHANTRTRVALTRSANLRGTRARTEQVEIGYDYNGRPNDSDFCGFIGPVCCGACVLLFHAV